MPKRQGQPGPFCFRDCALVVLATGISATDLRELRDGLLRVEAASLYHHFWGRLLQPQFDEPEFSNDLAAWAFHALHDRKLAEQLSAVDPTDYGSLEGLRSDLVDLAELRLDDGERPGWVQADEPFYFTQSRMIVFDTPLKANAPDALPDCLEHAGPGSIYYHFIAARRRNAESVDDFSAWLEGWGPAQLKRVAALRALDPYFSSLSRIHKELRAILAQDADNNHG